MAITDTSYVSFKNGKDYFALAVKGKPVPLFVSQDDFKGVIRAAGDLKTDIGKVTGREPEIVSVLHPENKQIVIIGTLGKNQLIDQLIQSNKLNVSSVKDQWEKFLIQVVDNPFPGINKALVIAGSDKRGTIYGVYDLSEQAGVSPWYWWDDVPVGHHESVYIRPGVYIQGPSVKYRGIFLNDEYPNLTRWIIDKYGMAKPSQNPPVPQGIANYGTQFYSKIFELILRLKGNYLWPAMWNNAFNEDDPENSRLADEYGIVMGTSHQEPMLRAQKEWDRRYLRTIGTWNYAKNPDTLQNFWREGIRRNKNYESIITMGLRGANDTEMAPGGPEANKSLLEKIIEEQRKILSEEMNPDLTKVPQLWCLYKEVQDYYKSGMRVPDDVTLLWAEDNWGNIRRLPTAEERKRPGGAGVYYHFDYHGGPRSYQWMNTSPIPKIWDQMSLAKQYGADQIWIVNVGHFKAYPIPLEYFMSLAWDSKKWTNNNINEYTREWARREFGEKFASDIADIVIKYTRYNGRRKPELLSPSTYSLINYQEGERVVADYKAILSRAEKIFQALPQSKQNAFYELVLFPVKACAIVNELYVTAGKNQLFARQGRASTNNMAAKTKELFSADTSLMGYYNRVFMNGRWNHFMDQAHLGYTSWNDPPVNSLRAIQLKEVSVNEGSEMGVSVEGDKEVWPGSESGANLPSFNVFSKKQHYLEIFNKGTTPFDYTVSADQPWISADTWKGTVQEDKRVWVQVDWSKVPSGSSKGSITVKALGKEVKIGISASNPSSITPQTLKGFVEGEGYVSIEAAHFAKNTPAGEFQWIKIEDYGHTLSAMRATSPANSAPLIPGKDAPCLEYQMYLFTPDTADVNAICAPTLNFMPDRPIRYAIAFDNQTPQTITLVPANYNAQNGNRDWEKSVSDNARFSHSKHIIQGDGYHTLKIWMIDPGVVLQKIVVDLGGVKASYLGPPESFWK